MYTYECSLKRSCYKPINVPYLLTKDEMGINSYEYIERAIGRMYATIIITSH